MTINIFQKEKTVSEVVQVHQPAEVLVPLDRAQAEKLDGRIRRLAKQAGDQLVQVGRLLDEAKAGRIHEALGFASWTAYVADSLGGTLQLSGAARQAMVELMAGEGMSVRAIASATGVSKSTVSNDLAQVSNHWTPQMDSDDSGVQPLDTSSEKPDVVTGIDGKTYTKPKPKPKGGKPAPKRRPDVRKGFEHMAVQVGGWASGLKDMDPSELVVDQEVQKGIDHTLKGIAAIRNFLDGVTPSRQPQVLTVFRDTLKEAAPLITRLTELTADPRWEKTISRFNHKDRTDLDATIAALHNLRGAMGELYNVTPAEDAKESA